MKTKYGTIKQRKFHGSCEYCKLVITEAESYRYVDESNHSITNNAPYLCKQCHNKQYWNDQVK